jgi:hypothetical protein
VKIYLAQEAKVKKDNQNLLPHWLLPILGDVIVHR